MPTQPGRTSVVTKASQLDLNYLPFASHSPSRNGHNSSDLIVHILDGQLKWMQTYRMDERILIYWPRTRQASKQHVLANGLAVSAHHQSVQLIVSVNRGCVLFRAQLIQIGLDGRHKQVQSL